ncbi:MAG TPA: DUF1553 domain-containing protein [Bryobacterales bacterium]|nr:DUF1553 domain-containing protein [Bryobacterales bacterium]
MFSAKTGRAGPRGRPRDAAPLSFLLAAVAVLAVPVSLPAADTVSYSKTVQPILKESCYVCHGEAAKESNLDLRTRESMLKGGKRGPAVVAGNPSQSLLYRHISGGAAPAMPLGGALEDRQITAIRAWIEQGAAVDGPGDQASAGQEVWWAFQPIAKPEPPKVDAADWNKHPVDAFIYRKLAAENLTPAQPADRRTLIRRAYLDLTGLLPQPREVEAFVDDTSSDAFDKVIERLLASPHYGERWGRHWLDVARYADSHGYEHDFDFPNAWRYRDYVIRAFNNDKPYDQFIREQLAGDELDEPTHDSLIATGFYRIGPRVGFREKDNPQYRYAYLDDMIATTSRAFMALSVDCARCHDHKFDPIAQLDYFRMMAVFFPFVNYDHPLVPRDQAKAYEEKNAAIEAQVAPLKKRIAQIQEPYEGVAFEAKLKEFPEEIQVAVHTPQAQRTAGQQLLAEQILSIGAGSVNHLLKPEEKTEIESLRAQIKAIEKDRPAALPVAMGVRDGDFRFAPDGAGDEVKPGKGERESYDFEGSFLPGLGKPFQYPKAHLLPTGDYQTKGPEVEPGFLHVLNPEDTFEPHLPAGRNDTTGNRRALAEWITSDGHPLTARVMANRIWAHHFGKGLVSTASNFGRLGQQPTHPELLDWLAVKFRESGWSVKAMHRLIMSSRTYQMSSIAETEKNSADPRNRFLWKFPQRRLEAEIIRDIVLDAAGTLNEEMGGEPFFPSLPESVWKSFGKGKWDLTVEGPNNWRRSVYSYWKRGLKYPLFEVLDQPDPSITCELRNVSTVPTQALTLLNNPFILGQAGLFAQRVAEEAGAATETRIRRAYQIALSRAPTTRELSRNVSFIERQRADHLGRGSSDADLDALVDLCDVILNLNEFVYLN